MATSATVIKKAKSLYGCKESNGTAQAKVIRPWNKWTGRSINCKTTKWCQTYCGSVIGAQCKVPYTKTNGCKQAAAYYKKIKRWKSKTTKPSVGDQIFVKKYNHTGIVTKVTAYYVTYISGNLSNAVRYSTIKWKNNSKIDGYGRPRYSSK